jgi:RNA polymerase sigma factor (sigma-70 family)
MRGMQRHAPGDEGAADSAQRDEACARSAAVGDDDAFAELYTRYAQRLYAYCWTILRDEGNAQDVLQSTWLNAFVALREGRRSAPIRPWLFRIAHNESISMLRRLEPAERTLRLSAPAPSAEEQALRRERLHQVFADLHALPERTRSAIVMRELCGLTHAEIALALETTVGGAKQAILEARRELQDFVAGRETACTQIRTKISTGDRRLLRGRSVRAHLRHCAPCSAFSDAVQERRNSLSALIPPLAPFVTERVLGEVLRSGGRHHALASAATSAGSASAAAGGGGAVGTGAVGGGTAVGTGAVGGGTAVGAAGKAVGTALLSKVLAAAAIGSVAAVAVGVDHHGRERHSAAPRVMPAHHAADASRVARVPRVRAAVLAAQHVNPRPVTRPGTAEGSRRGHHRHPRAGSRAPRSPRSGVRAKRSAQPRLGRATHPRTRARSVPRLHIPAPSHLNSPGHGGRHAAPPGYVAPWKGGRHGGVARHIAPPPATHRPRPGHIAPGHPRGRGAEHAPHAPPSQAARHAPPAPGRSPGHRGATSHGRSPRK